MFYSYFPSKHLSRLPSVPQVHHHIFQNSLKENYTSVYVADLCVVDTLKCYYICSHLHSTLHTCIISNDKNVICPGMRWRLVVCCLISTAKRPASDGMSQRQWRWRQKYLLTLQYWLSSPWTDIFMTRITNVSFWSFCKIVHRIPFFWNMVLNPGYLEPNISKVYTWADPKFSGLVPPSAQQLC